MGKTGAEIIIQCLVEQGVSKVFGYPGGSVLALYDALYKEPSIAHVLMTHEQHVAHAADGYARASGKVGVALATSGPGATNLLTGLSAAYIDSSPVVAITCNVRSAIIGTDAFQEVDIYGISMPVTKHNFLLHRIEDVADTLRHAFHIARSGRPGPVLVDIPMDLLIQSHTYTPVPPAPILQKETFTKSQLQTAAQLLNVSSRPLLLLGGGAKSGIDRAQAMAEKLCAPIAHTLLGTGCAVCENNVGLLGMYGESLAAELLLQADVVLAIGTRFSERTIPNPQALSKHAKIIHIDIDPAELDKNISADVGIQGDAEGVLSQLLPLCDSHASPWWLKPVSDATSPQHCTDYAPESILQTLDSLVGSEQIYTTEVGQHQLWAAKYLQIQSPRHFITSGGLGAMGFGLGAAIGAALATKRRVINIAGDGSFYMNMAELSTITAYQLPIIEIVFVNHSLGLVQQLQEENYGRSFEATLCRDTNFVQLAQAFGIEGYRITKQTEVLPTLQAVLAQSVPAVVEIVLPYEAGTLRQIQF